MQPIFIKRSVAFYLNCDFTKLHKIFHILECNGKDGGDVGVKRDNGIERGVGDRGDSDVTDNPLQV